jgi:hypothetical protein
MAGPHFKGFFAALLLSAIFSHRVLHAKIKITQ